MHGRNREAADAGLSGDGISRFGPHWRAGFVTPGLDVATVESQERYGAMRAEIMAMGERVGTTQAHPLKCPEGKQWGSQWAVRTPQSFIDFQVE